MLNKTLVKNVTSALIHCVADKKISQVISDIAFASVRTVKHHS
jgi:DNA-binding CsgD family transcriptional regulator